MPIIASEALLRELFVTGFFLFSCSKDENANIDISVRM